MNTAWFSKNLHDRYGTGRNTRQLRAHVQIREGETLTRDRKKIARVQCANGLRSKSFAIPAIIGWYKLSEKVVEVLEPTWRQCVAICVWTGQCVNCGA